MEENNYSITDNRAQMQFEIHIDNSLAFLQYRFYKSDIALMHTVVPDNLAGRGLASALAHYGLEWAKEHDKKVMVYCPFVAAYLKKHPEYNAIIDRQYK